MELLWFVIGAVVGVIVLAVICCVIKIELPGDTQPEFSIPKDDSENVKIYIQSIDALRDKNSSLNIKNNELEKEVDYWKRNAIKDSARLGEIKIKTEQFREKWEK